MDNKQTLACPYCGNTDPDLLSVRKKPVAWASVMALLLWNFPLLYRRYQAHCFNCREDFPPPQGFHKTQEK